MLFYALGTCDFKLNLPHLIAGLASLSSCSETTNSKFNVPYPSVLINPEVFHYNKPHCVYANVFVYSSTFFSYRPQCEFCSLYRRNESTVGK